ncbi:hypothetical protein D3C86_1323420 [compost metagenome]
MVDRLGHVVEDLGHLLGGLEVEVGPVVHLAGGIQEALAGLDAQQRLVRSLVARVGEVAVVGARDLDARALGEFEQGLVDLLLLGEAVVLDLQVEVVTEGLLVPARARLGLLVAAMHDVLGDLATQASRQCDQAFGVRGDGVLVDARLVVEALHVAQGVELDQVLVTGAVLGEQHQVAVILAAGAVRGLVEPGAGRDVGFHPDQGLDARLLGLAVELDRAVHHAVVGERQGRHLVLRRALDQLADAAGAVQQGVFGVNVAVDELRWHDRDPFERLVLILAQPRG